MVVAAAQLDGAPPALLSSNRTAGPGPDAAGALGPKLRVVGLAGEPLRNARGCRRSAVDDPRPRIDRRPRIEGRLGSPRAAENIELGDLPARRRRDIVVAARRVDIGPRRKIDAVGGRGDVAGKTQLGQVGDHLVGNRSGTRTVPKAVDIPPPTSPDSSPPDRSCCSESASTG